MNVKTDRIASNMMKEISYILANEIKDEHIKFVTVTDVNLTSDLSNAKVYVTVLNRDKITETMKALKIASRFIRRELASRIEVRHIPELEFVYDESIEYGQRIENILENINKEKEENE